MSKNKWLDRRISAPGPYLTLCLSEDEFNRELKRLAIKESVPWVKTPQAQATVHFLTNQKSDTCAIVCLRDYENRNPVEVAGLLVHEAVHVWQDYAERIGERQPGTEQEAYAIQAIAQELMAEFARRMT